jgi:hypothetical protein
MWDLWWRIGTGVDLLLVLWIPLPVLISLTPTLSPIIIIIIIIHGWYNRPIVADLPSGLSLTPPHPMGMKERAPHIRSLDTSWWQISGITLRLLYPLPVPVA